MKIDLNGKIALVTGASRGIGKETAVVLAEAGARVIINYKATEEAARQLHDGLAERGLACETVRADVSDPDDVAHLFDAIRQKHGRIDILVNNAGVIRDNLLLTMELSDWDKVVDLNLRGAFLCTKHAAELMLPNHAGKIINVSSVGALRGGRGQTNYAAAKGGLISFTRACAVELSGKGIQVNAVLPGLIETDMTKRVRKRAGDEILKAIPSGRFGTPQDVARLILFLASSLSDYITGQAIAVDGGMTAL